MPAGARMASKDGLSRYRPAGDEWLRGDQVPAHRGGTGGRRSGRDDGLRRGSPRPDRGGRVRRPLRKAGRYQESKGAAGARCPCLTGCRTRQSPPRNTTAGFVMQSADQLFPDVTTLEAAERRITPHLALGLRDGEDVEQLVGR